MQRRNKSENESRDTDPITSRMIVHSRILLAVAEECIKGAKESGGAQRWLVLLAAGVVGRGHGV